MAKAVWPKEFQASVSIGNWHNGGKSEIVIEIEDIKTGRRVAEVHMTHAEFSQAVTGVRSRPAVGKRWRA